MMLGTPAAAAGAALGLAAAILLQGCGSNSRPRPESQPLTRVGTRVWPPALPPQLMPDNDDSPTCSGFSVQVPYGTIRVAPSWSGESPKITCPNDLEYNGPRMQCGWVDTVCAVDYGKNGAVMLDCRKQHNLTLEGHGLNEWPDGVSMKLVSSKRSSTTGYTSGRPDWRAALPDVIEQESINCSVEASVDLDFEHAKVTTRYPPFSQDVPWMKSYANITYLGEQKVDMQVMHADGLQAPGNVFMDGNSSVTGRININQSGSSALRFSFLEAGTQKSVVLGKLIFTVFDVSSLNNDTPGVKVTVGNFSEYHLSRNSCIDVLEKAGEGSYEFYGSDRCHQDPSTNITDMWLNSLRRSVSFTFRRTSEFMLTVQASPWPAGQVLEFAGRSEIVDVGKRVVLGGRAQEVNRKKEVVNVGTVGEATSKVAKAIGGMRITAAIGGPPRWSTASMIAAASAIGALVMLPLLTLARKGNRHVNAVRRWKERLDFKALCGTGPGSEESCTLAPLTELPLRTLLRQPLE